MSCASLTTCRATLLLPLLLPLLLGAGADEGGDAQQQQPGQPQHHERCFRGEEMKKAELKRLEDFVAEQRAKPDGRVDSSVLVQIRALKWELANLAQHPAVVQCEVEESQADAAAVAAEQELAERAKDSVPTKYRDCYRRVELAVADVRRYIGAPRQTADTKAQIDSAMRTFREAQGVAFACSHPEASPEGMTPEQRGARQATIDHERYVAEDDAAEKATAKRRAAAASSLTSRRQAKTAFACLYSTGYPFKPSRLNSSDGAVMMMSDDETKVSLLMSLDRRDVVQGAVVVVQRGGDLAAGATLYFALGSCLTGLDKAQVARALLQPALAKVGGAFFRTVKTTSAKFAVAWTESDVRELAQQ
jgi:hypothetical protein